MSVLLVLEIYLLKIANWLWPNLRFSSNFFFFSSKITIFLFLLFSMELHPFSNLDPYPIVCESRKKWIPWVRERAVLFCYASYKEPMI